MAKKNIRRGMFITFEGPEGCGKTTHSKLIVEYLRSRGKRAIYTREPGGTKIGEGIREVLLNRRNKAMSIMTEAFLYLAARAQVTKEIIKPALKMGKIVVCDRFQDATVVYQGYAGGLDMGMLDKLGKIATSGLRPDLSIFLDIDTELGLKRAGCKACPGSVSRQARDRMEKKSIAFHRKVRWGYLALAEKEPKRIKIVKVKGSILQTQRKIRDIVGKYVF